MTGSPEQTALAEAISWSNANLYFSDDSYSSDIDERVAADILRGLQHFGWKLVPAAAALSVVPETPEESNK